MIVYIRWSRDSYYGHVENAYSNRISVRNKSTESIEVSKWQWVNEDRKENIYFLKIHKTATSTLTGILDAYIFRNNFTRYLTVDHPYLHKDIKAVAVPFAGICILTVSYIPQKQKVGMTYLNIMERPKCMSGESRF